MLITRLKLQNWRNFKRIEVDLRDRVFVIGPNASGKSNLLDVFRFLRDVAKPKGGGLQRAVEARGGMTKLRCLLARRDPEVVCSMHLGVAQVLAQSGGTVELQPMGAPEGCVLRCSG